MKIIRTANYEELSKQAAKMMITRIKSNPNIILGLATGSTPIGTYQLLIDDHLKNGTSYENITTVNLDEYAGLNPADPNSYHFFMQDKLFKHINIPASHTHLPEGTAENLLEECRQYEELIKKKGGIDLQLLGIGGNGHIGFNEPGTSFDSRTHVVILDEQTRQANARFFRSIEEVPTHALTMGIATIMESKEVLLLASGKSKAEAVKQLIHGDITEELPASILKNHKSFTLIADEEALSLS